VSAHHFYKIFRDYGDIRSSKLVVDYLGKSKGYGYVNFYNSTDALNSKAHLNETQIDGKKILITDLIPGKVVERKKNNIYVKHIPKEKFNDQDLEVRIVLINFNLEYFQKIW